MFLFYGEVSADPLLLLPGSAAPCLVPASVCWRPASCRRRRPSQNAGRAPHRGTGSGTGGAATGPARDAAGEPRHHGKFEVEQVRARFADHLLPVPRVELDGDGISHGAARQEERGFLTESRGARLLEAVDCRILAEHVVADLGFGHGAPHSFSGTGHTVASQDDEVTHIRSLEKSSVSSISSKSVPID